MADRLSFRKDPNAVLDYLVDWSSWLGEDTLETSTWIVPAEPSDPPVVQSDGLSTTTTTVWLSGGELYNDYAFVNRITTAAGRTEDRTVTFRIRNG
jgi:hypothetical protein